MTYETQSISQKLADQMNFVIKIGDNLVCPCYKSYCCTITACTKNKNQVTAQIHCNTYYNGFSFMHPLITGRSEFAYFSI